jgi:EAL domain-containing protein (putative c-di-GMP-specific phosphodiesterase class I)/PleD family two-component response regulator
MNNITARKTNDVPMLMQDRLRILISDDSSLERFIACESLVKDGVKVIESSNGEEALNLVKSEKFDAILLDAKMPVMNGFKACELIRKHLKDESIPIIIATGLDDQDSIDKAFLVGATDYVTKPINWSILKRRIQHYIDSNEKRLLLSSQNDQVLQLINASSDTSLTLDEMSNIKSINSQTSLPEVLMKKLTISNNLFNAFGNNTKDMEQAWKNVLETRKPSKFVVCNMEMTDSYRVEGQFHQGSHNNIICLLKDATQRYIGEQKIANLAYYDEDTGVANLSSIRKTITHLLEEKLEDSSISIIRCRINKMLEHESRLGQQGVKQLACLSVERMQHCLTESNLSDVSQVIENKNSKLKLLQQNIVARFSSQEFAILLPTLSSTEKLVELINQLKESLSEPFAINNNDVVVEFSFGAATSSQETSKSSDLIAEANIAMNSQKDDLGNNTVIYSNVMKQRLLENTQLEDLLRRDIRNSELNMHYQPKFNTSSLELIGMEALMRWTSKELGVISPNRFIPLAESSNLMGELSQLVVNKTMAQTISWMEQGLIVPVSINLNGKDLNNKSLVNYLVKQLNDKNIPPSYIQVEVTESIMVDASNGAMRHLQELRQLGVKIAIDDFGTGYSSFSYLKNLPVDILKIDKSFVDNIHLDKKSYSIAKAIITIGHDLGLEVIAEGVEYEEQLEELRKLGCDSVQGYLTGRPVDALSFEAHLSTYRQSA